MYRQISNQATDVELQTVDFGSLSISTCYVDLLNEQSLEFFHAHQDSIELYYALSDNLEMHLLDERIPVQPIGLHDFVLINSGVGHNVDYTPNRPKKYFVVTFSVTKSGTQAPGQPAPSKTELSFYSHAMRILNQNPYLILHDHDNALADVIDQIIRCAVQRGRYWKLLRRTLYAQLIVLALGACKALPSQETSEEQNIAIAVTQYLHANYQNPQLTLETLSREFNFSPRQLIRVFEHYFSRTPSKTLTFYRINYAKNYLINTDWTTAAIAEAVGFSSAASLSRCFKEFENMTISEFREQNRNARNAETL